MSLRITRKSLRYASFAVFSLTLISALLWANGSRAGWAGPSAPEPLVPMLSATKTGVQLNDPQGANGVINPGDSIRYTVTINNTGPDPATNVNMSDTIDAHTTFIGGSLIASPIAVNDSYDCIGNVGISVPGASGVFSNDLNPNGSGAFSITASNLAGLQGTLSLNTSTGGFDFNPNPGFEGMTSFSYTLSNGTGFTDTATVTINVTGMIWFVDNNAGSNGDGRLATPFSTLANFNAGAADDPGDNIFLYRQAATNYTGGITLLANQKLIGQGATATLATIAGITVPPFSNTLPATNGTRPTLTHTANNVILSTGNTLRGLNIQSTSGSALFGTSFNNLTASENTASATGGTAAVNLSQSSGTAAINVTFISISANGSTNGLILANTTGSLTVAGDGGGSNNGSGGTIQNTTGFGVTLNVASNVTLGYMNIQSSGDSGIKGLSVTNFTLNRSNVTGNGNSTSDEGIQFGEFSGTTVGATGNVTITNCNVSSNAHNNFHLRNTSGTISLFTVTNSSFNTLNDTFGANSFLYEMSGTSVTTAASITACNFNDNSPQRGMEVQTHDTGRIGALDGSTTFSVSGSTFMHNGIHASFTQDTASNLAFKLLSSNFQFTETPSNSGLQAINVFASSTTTGGSITGTISGNTIGTAGVCDSGSQAGSGIRLLNQAKTAGKFLIDNNVIREASQARGIDAQFLGTIATGQSVPTSDITITNNNVNHVHLTCHPGSSDFPLAAIFLAADNQGSAGTVRANIQNNIVPTAASVGTGSFDYPTFSGTDKYLIYEELTGGDGQLVDAPPVSPNANAEIISHNTGDAYANNAISLIPGPIGVPPIAPTSTDNPDQEPVASTMPGAAGLGDIGNLQYSVSRTLTELVSQTFLAFHYGITSLPIPEFVRTANAQGAESQNTTKSDSPTSGETVAKSLGTLPPGKNIRVQFDVTVDNPTSVTSVSNSANITADGGININSTTATNTVVQPTTISKAFAPALIAVNGTSTLTFTVTNPNPSQSISQITFTDNFPAGLVVANPTNASTTCGGTLQDGGGGALGSGDTGIKLINGSRAAGASCTVTVDVTSAADGVYNNVSGNVSSFEGLTGGTASATLTVISPPTFTKAFGASSVVLNGSTSLTFTITNTSAATGLSGVGFTDTLVAGLVVATPNGFSTTCTGTPSAVAGSSSVSLSGGTLAASGSCTLTVNVTGTTAGAKPNSATLTTTELGASSATTGTVTLNVFAPPTVSKFFINPAQGNTNNTNLNGTARLSIAITNPPGNAGSLSGLAITDTFPAGMEVDASPSPTNTCGGTFAPVAAATSISLTGGGPLTVGNQCVISVVIKATMAGALVNTTGNVSSTEGGSGGTASGTLNVFAPPVVTKSFSPTSVPLNGTSMMTLSIQSPNSGTNLTGVNLTDNFPAGMVAGTPPVVSSTNCGGLAITDSGGGSFQAGDTGIRLNNFLAPNSVPCVVVINVVGTTVGDKVNMTDAPTSPMGGTGLPASATLAVLAAPSFTKAFGAASRPVNSATSLTFNITNNDTSHSITGVGFTDTLPAGMVVATPANITGTCGGGTITATAGAGSISLSGATLAASGTCSFSADVVGTTPGMKMNSVDLTTNETGTGPTATASIDILPCTPDPIVTTNADSGAGSLRQAVIDACPDSTITFDMNTVVSPITLLTGQINIDKNLIIQGPGANLLTVSGNMASRVFYVSPGVTAQINALTVADGSASGSFPTGFGAGIYNDQATLTISDSIIRNNIGTGDGGGIFNDSGNLTVNSSSIRDNSGSSSSGGGIANRTVSSGASVVTVNNSTVSGNSASDGGGLYNQCGISANATLNIVNSTISGNNATSGGGIKNDAVGAVATTNVSNSTIAYNTATSNSGGIRSSASPGTAVLTLNSTIVSNNTISGNPNDFQAGFIDSVTGSYNLVKANNGVTFSSGTNNLLGVDPLLALLANNGGATMTHALLAGSPAIDKGNAFGTTTDQRGITRPLDFLTIPPASGGDNSDIGAFELQPPPQSDLSITKTDGVASAVPGGSVTYTITASNAGPGSGNRCECGRHIPSYPDRHMDMCRRRRRDMYCVRCGQYQRYCQFAGWRICDLHGDRLGLSLSDRYAFEYGYSYGSRWCDRSERG